MKIMINTEVTPENRCNAFNWYPTIFRLFNPQDNETQLKEVVDTDVILGGFNRALFDNAQQLKWVQVLGCRC